MVVQHPHKVSVAGSSPAITTNQYLAGVNGSMTVSKTVGGGSNPSRDANLGC